LNQQQKAYSGSEVRVLFSAKRICSMAFSNERDASLVAAFLSVSVDLRHRVATGNLPPALGWIAGSPGAFACAVR
jgi:hypothetical protein